MGLGGGPPVQQLKKVFGSQYKIFSKLISDNKLVFSEVFLHNDIFAEAKAITHQVLLNLIVI